MIKKITFWPGLLTAIGTVIGSGIFFKSDDILRLTNGNVTTAIIGWIIFGISLTFAGISVSVVAQHTNSPGGSVGYIKDIFGEKYAFLVGWFEAIIYMPILISLLSIVASIFFFQFIGYDTRSISPLIINSVALLFIFITFFYNYISTRLSALFSSTSTIIKFLPIIIIAAAGLINFDHALIMKDLKDFQFNEFTSPLLSMSFSFGGWIVVATLSKDMENPQRDMGKILAINALIITIAYVMYFIGITMLMPANEIISYGDAHVALIANRLLGNYGEKILLFCVLISVLGTLNGKVIGGFRYPHALAQQKDIPFSSFFRKESKFKTNGTAALLTLVISLIWFTCYTIQAIAKTNASVEALATKEYMFSGISFEDIPIMIVSFEAIALMVGGYLLAKRHKLGVFKTYIAPFVGIVGQIYVVVSFVHTNSSWLFYMFISAIIIGIGVSIRTYLKRKDTFQFIVNKSTAFQHNLFLPLPVMMTTLALYAIPNSQFPSHKMTFYQKMKELTLTFTFMK
ncbi:APC family permease [Neisseria sp. Ec49-e6-T10]|uniref:APC family permease n=1 Tax=Neisseria sp. Ec49-e6-T10 TaxID=3140744 RepID=UPI003EBD2CBC